MQNSQEIICVRVFLIKLQAFGPATLLKRLQYRCFPVNFAKFLGTPVLKNIYKRLLLHLKYYTPANNTAKVVAKYSKTEQQELSNCAMKVQGELLGCFFQCTLEWLQPYFPNTSCRLMVLWNRIECNRME